MKRSGPIRRQTPLKRTGFKRESRTPLKQMSAKTRAKQPARKACCAAVRKRCEGRCEVRIVGTCAGAMRDTHEILARSQGGSTTDPANCLGVCRPCHDAIHANPKDARKKGLLL